jgi:hypothetical protein
VHAALAVCLIATGGMCKLLDSLLHLPTSKKLRHLPWPCSTSSRSFKTFTIHARQKISLGHLAFLQLISSPRCSSPTNYGMFNAPRYFILNNFVRYYRRNVKKYMNRSGNSHTKVEGILILLMETGGFYCAFWVRTAPSSFLSAHSKNRYC